MLPSPSNSSRGGVKTGHERAAEIEPAKGVSVTVQVNLAAMVTNRTIVRQSLKHMMQNLRDL